MLNGHGDDVDDDDSRDRQVKVCTHHQVVDEETHGTIIGMIGGTQGFCHKYKLT